VRQNLQGEVVQKKVAKAQYRGGGRQNRKSVMGTQVEDPDGWGGKKGDAYKANLFVCANSTTLSGGHTRGNTGRMKTKCRPFSYRAGRSRAKCLKK